MKHLRIFNKIYEVENFHYTNLNAETNPATHVCPLLRNVRRYDISDGTVIFSYGQIPATTTDFISRLTTLMLKLQSQYNLHPTIDLLDGEHRKLIIRLSKSITEVISND